MSRTQSWDTSTKSTKKNTDSGKKLVRVPKDQAGVVPERHQRRGSLLRRVIDGPKFPQLFVAGSLTILLATSLFWSVLSARLQETNADQFSDAYLFENWPTFHGALFPGAHTFLVKWPVFALMHLGGYSTAAFLAMTVAMVLVTVGTLAYIMYRIEPRPMVFGTLCLLLASVLLLIPAQPYPGAPLPVNFAMTTTRNLEYALFVWCLYKVVAITSLRRRAYWVLAGLLALTIASDKLFAVLLTGSGLMVLVVSYGLLRRRSELPTAVRLLLIAGISTAAAYALLFIISRTGLTHIVNEAAASPYPAVHSFRQVVLGSIYGIAALLTVLGANPVHANVLVRALPHDVLQSLLRPSIFAYAVNLLVLVFGWVAAIHVTLKSSVDRASRLTVALVGSTLAATAVFVLTDHYFPVDARYVAIELFMIFVALATYMVGRTYKVRYALALSLLALFVIPLGMARTMQEYGAGRAATALERQVISKVSDALGRNHIDRLIGDYWKVMPIKAHDGHSLTVMPTDSCGKPHGVLTSTAWQKLAATTPSAVIATRSSKVAVFDGCSLATLSTVYGVPSKRIALAREGTAPFATSQFLLIYPNGTHPLREVKTVPAASRSVAPPTVEAMSHQADCKGTSLNIVAHQDDDLLFMNPDIFHDLKAGRCVRTVYLTAGDAGAPAAYWQDRERGSQAAYAEMLGATNSWHQQRELLNGTYVTIATLDKVPTVSLIFMRLPDGNFRGGGFKVTHNESLHELFRGKIKQMHTVDDNAPITKDQLIAMLHTLIMTDTPDTIRSKGSTNLVDGDHSDHHAAGRLTKLAAMQDPLAPAITLYLGYPDKLQPANLTDDDIALKENTFLTYAKYDGAVCQTVLDCQQTYTYGHYLKREYIVGSEATEKVSAASPEPASIATP